MSTLDKLIKKWEQEEFKRAEFQAKNPVLSRICNKLRHRKIILAIQVSLVLSLIWFSVLIIVAWLNPEGNVIKENFQAAFWSEQWNKLDASEKKALVDQMGEENLKRAYKSLFKNVDRIDLKR